MLPCVVFLFVLRLKLLFLFKRPLGGDVTRQGFALLWLGLDHRVQGTISTHSRSSTSRKRIQIDRRGTIHTLLLTMRQLRQIIYTQQEHGLRVLLDQSLPFPIHLTLQANPHILILHQFLLRLTQKAHTPKRIVSERRRRHAHVEPQPTFTHAHVTRRKHIVHTKERGRERERDRERDRDRKREVRNELISFPTVRLTYRSTLNFLFGGSSASSSSLSEPSPSAISSADLFLCLPFIDDGSSRPRMRCLWA